MKIKVFCISILSLLVIVGGCISRKNISNDPEFKPYIGKEYRLVKDLLVITYQDNKKDLCFDEFGERGLNVSEDELKGKKFPITFESETIHWIAPAGTIIKIIRIEEESSMEGSSLDYITRIVSDGPFKGREVYASLIKDLKTYHGLSSEFAQDLNPSTGTPVRPAYRKGAGNPHAFIDERNGGGYIENIVPQWEKKTVKKSNSSKN